MNYPRKNGFDPKYFLKIFFQLVQLDGVSLHEKPVADYIRKFLSHYHIPVFEDEAGIKSGGNSGNLIALVHPPGQTTTQPHFALMAHMDTVVSTAGVHPRVRDGRIESDGTTILGADNRAGIALILYLIHRLYQYSIPFQPFEVIFTIGEESGLYGSTYLDLTKVLSRTVYILDSSSDPGCFVVSSPSAVEFTLSFIGRPSHAGVNPEAGINAISMCGQFLHRFPVGRLNDSTTINVGFIQGGEGTNVVASDCQLKGEIRSFDPHDKEKFIHRLDTLAHEIASAFQGKYQLKVTEAFPGFSLPLDHPSIDRLVYFMKGIGLQPSPLQYPGASDANILNQRGITAIDLGIGAKNPHSVHEYITLSDLEVVSHLLFRMVTLP